MKAFTKLAVVCAGLLALGMPGVSAQEKAPHTGDVPYEGISAHPVPLPFPLTDVLGTKIEYPDGEAKISAYVITLQPGSATELHKHDVPLFGYMLEGTLEVDYGTKGKKTFKAGDGFMEAFDWCHAGRTVGSGPAKLLAVYLGNAKLKVVSPCPE